MARHLYTSVVLTDPEDQEVQFGPKDDLPDWAVKQLTESWGKHRTDLWGEEDEPDPEQVALRASGKPVQADREHAKAQAKAAKEADDEKAVEEQKAADEKAAREAGAKAAASESKRSGSS